MGFLKKITRPISRVLDKIVPNELKPALPFLAAAAPFMAPGLMSIGGGTMFSRALMSGGLNLGAQLAQEGSDGDFSGLSTLMAAATGALSTPGSAGGRTIGDTGKSYSQYMGGDKLASAGTQSAGDYLRGLSNSGGITDQSLNFLGTGADKLVGLSEGLAADGIFSKAGAKALSIPLTQGTMDLATAENRRLEKQQAIDDALSSAEGLADNSSRASAIRNSMTAYGFFTDEEIEDTISSAGYRAGGRVGYAFGDFVKGSGVAQPVSASMRSGDRPMMSGSGMGGMLSNMINNNPQLFSNLTGQGNNSVSNMSRDFIDLNENGIDDRQEKAIGGRVGLKGGGTDKMEQYKQYVSDMIKDGQTPVDFEDFLKMTDYKTGGRVGLKGGGADFGGIPAAIQNIQEDAEEMITIMTDNGPIQIEKSVYESMPGMFMDTTTSAYGDAGRGRPVPQFAEGGLMNLGGREMDMRGGGFIPIGKKERADDVPARLSKNEFVMTADAVRAAGGGSVNEGAKRMYETMNRLEARA